MCSNILRTRHSSKSKLKASKANQTILDLPGRQRASDVGGARRRDGAGEGEILMGPLSHLEVTGEPYLEDCGQDQVRAYALLGTANWRELLSLCRNTLAMAGSLALPHRTCSCVNTFDSNATALDQAHAQVLVMQLKVNVNQRAPTIEDMLGRRRSLIASVAENLAKEIR